MMEANARTRANLLAIDYPIAMNNGLQAGQIFNERRTIEPRLDNRISTMQIIEYEKTNSSSNLYPEISIGNAGNSQSLLSLPNEIRLDDVAYNVKELSFNESSDIADEMRRMSLNKSFDYLRSKFSAADIDIAGSTSTNVYQDCNTSENLWSLFGNDSRVVVPNVKDLLEGNGIIDTEISGRMESNFISNSDGMDLGNRAVKESSKRMTTVATLRTGDESAEEVRTFAGNSTNNVFLVINISRILLNFKHYKYKLEKGISLNIDNETADNSKNNHPDYVLDDRFMSYLLDGSLEIPQDVDCSIVFEMVLFTCGSAFFSSKLHLSLICEPIDIQPNFEEDITSTEISILFTELIIKIALKELIPREVTQTFPITAVILYENSTSTWSHLFSGLPIFSLYELDEINYGSDSEGDEDGGKVLKIVSFEKLIYFREEPPSRKAMLTIPIHYRIQVPPSKQQMNTTVYMTIKRKIPIENYFVKGMQAATIVKQVLRKKGQLIPERLTVYIGCLKHNTQLNQSQMEQIRKWINEDLIIFTHFIPKIKSQSWIDNKYLKIICSDMKTVKWFSKRRLLMGTLHIEAYQLLELINENRKHNTWDIYVQKINNSHLINNLKFRENELATLMSTIALIEAEKVNFDTWKPLIATFVPILKNLILKICCKNLETAIWLAKAFEMIEVSGTRFKLKRLFILASKKLKIFRTFKRSLITFSAGPHSRILKFSELIPLLRASNRQNYKVDWKNWKLAEYKVSAAGLSFKVDMPHSDAEIIMRNRTAFKLGLNKCKIVARKDC